MSCFPNNMVAKKQILGFIITTDTVLDQKTKKKKKEKKLDHFIIFYLMKLQWSVFDKKLKICKLLNKIELFNILNNYWQQLSHGFCQSVVENVARFCQAVIDANRYSTNIKWPFIVLVV